MTTFKPSTYKKAIINLKHTFYDLVIIGSGISGLSAASFARDLNKKTLIVDKGFYPGGRLSSKNLAEFKCDYGSKSFSIQSDNFYQFLTKNAENSFSLKLDPIKDTKVVIGNPCMRQLILSLAKNLNVLQKTEVSEIIHDDSCYQIKNGSKVIAHIAVVLTLLILIALVGKRLPISIENGGIGLFRVAAMSVISLLAFFSFSISSLTVPKKKL